MRCILGNFSANLKYFVLKQFEWRWLHVEHTKIHCFSSPLQLPHSAYSPRVNPEHILFLWGCTGKGLAGIEWVLHVGPSLWGSLRNLLVCPLNIKCRGSPSRISLVICLQVLGRRHLWGRYFRGGTEEEACDEDTSVRWRCLSSELWTICEASDVDVGMAHPSPG